MRRGVLAAGAAGVLAAAGHLLSAGFSEARLEPAGVVKEAWIYPAVDLLAWACLLLAAAVLLGRLLPEDAVPRLRALLLRPRPALFAAAAGLWVALAGMLVAQVLLSGEPSDIDDIARLHQARCFGEGRLSFETGPEPDPFTVYGLVRRDGRTFSKYEPVPALLYAASWRTLGRPTALNPLLGGLLVVLAYGVFRRAGAEGTARAATVLLCLSPFLLFMSGSLLTHVLAAALVAGVCLLLAPRGAGEPAAGPGTIPLLLAGALLSLGLASRPYTTFLAGGTLAAWCVLRDGLAPAPRRAAAILLGAAPGVALLLLYNDALTGDPLLSPFRAFDPREVPWFGYMGHTPAEGLANGGRMLLVLNQHLFGWPSSLLFLPLFLLRERTWLDRVSAAVALSLVLGHLSYYWIDFRFGPRYWYEAVPFLAWLTARGMGGLDAFLRGIGVPATGHRSALAALLLFTLFGAVFYLGSLLRLYGRDYGHIAPVPAAAVREGLREAPTLVLLPEVDTAENGGFSSAFLANPLDLAAVARLDRAAAALGPGATEEALGRAAAVPAAAVAGIRASGRVLFARELDASTEARLRAAYPGRRVCRLDRDPVQGGVVVWTRDGGEALPRVLLRAR